MNVDKIDYRQVINDAIKERKVKKREIAEHIGVNKTYLYNYLNGVAQMSAVKIRKMCEMLGLDYVGKTNFESEKGETWAKLKGKYAGLYLVSSLGRIYSCRNDRFVKIAKAKENRVPQIAIKDKDGKIGVVSVARLIAEGFIEDYNGEHVCHLNGDKNDNRADNLTIRCEETKERSVLGVGRKTCVRNVESGIIFKSIKDAAEAMKIPYYLLRLHTSNKKEDVNGLHFEPVSRQDAERFELSEEQKSYLANR